MTICYLDLTNYLSGLHFTTEKQSTYKGHKPLNQSGVLHYGSGYSRNRYSREVYCMGVPI